MFKVVISKRAARIIKTFPKRYQNSARIVLRELRDDPFLGKPLSRELKGRFSIKLGNYRIIYLINSENQLISVIDAGHRSYIYD